MGTYGKCVYIITNNLGNKSKPLISFRTGRNESIGDSAAQSEDGPWSRHTYSIPATTSYMLGWILLLHPSFGDNSPCNFH